MRYISVIRAMVRQLGLRVPSGGAEGFCDRLAKVELPADVQETQSDCRLWPRQRNGKR